MKTFLTAAALVASATAAAAHDGMIIPSDNMISQEERR